MRTLLALLLLCASVPAQELPSRWDELTAGDWPRAQERAAYTCVLPIGILEKHGPHLPMGSDLIHVRELAARAARQEYAVVFPDFYFGQIYEAQHTPGTFALPSRVVWDLLEATVEEIARNGFKKIVIVNGHGGNPDLLRFFVQSQLERRRDYVVYFFTPAWDEEFERKQKALRKSDLATDMHAGESESYSLLFLRPDLVQLGRAGRSCRCSARWSSCWASSRWRSTPRTGSFGGGPRPPTPRSTARTSRPSGVRSWTSRSRRCSS
jgi:creatinine amidohydrolase